MFPKCFVYALFAATIVSALPQGDPQEGSTTTNTVTKNIHKCDVGQLTCCEQTAEAGSQGAQKITGLISGAVGDITGIVGLNCNAITGIGASVNSCSAQPVCCSKNNFHGTAVVGCSPVKVL
ncbi:Fruiting body protein SC3 [Leucoagaricus sp. SymC.cos]|nr:Fruiting body protein SC3 [Leucoagaricus sp. SymC.cos]